MRIVYAFFHILRMHVSLQFMSYLEEKIESVQNKLSKSLDIPVFSKYIE